jgi:hypothetical protein
MIKAIKTSPADGAGLVGAVTVTEDVPFPFAPTALSVTFAI